MNDKMFETLRQKVKEVYALEPNDLHFPLLTSAYKFSTRPLKTFPFKLIIPVSIAAGIFAYVVIGILITRAVSILQYGF